MLAFPLGQQIRYAPHLRLGVQRRKEKTQTRLVLRHPDLNDRRNVIAVVHQMAGSRQSLKAVRKKDRDDAAPDGRPRIEPRVMGKLHEEFGILAQTLNAPSLFFHHWQGGLRRRRYNWR